MLAGDQPSLAVAGMAVGEIRRLAVDADRAGFLFPLQVFGIYIIPGVIAIAVFGPNVKYRLNKDTFPYTDPSLEMEVDVDGKWVEVVGCGVVKGSVLKKLGVDPDNYTGWAFGFGIERIAMIRYGINDIRLFYENDVRFLKQF